MTLIDANILIYAEDSSSVHHSVIRLWWDDLLSSGHEVALCWPVLSGFLRLVTNPKILQSPMTPCRKSDSWLAVPGVKILEPGMNHWRFFSAMIKGVPCRANLVSDAHLAALAMEHDCELASCDTDFARFQGLKWNNPLPV